MKATIDPNFDAEAYEQRKFYENVAPVADEMAYTPRVEQRLSSENFMPYSVYERYTDNAGVLDRATEAMKKQGVDFKSLAQEAPQTEADNLKDRLSSTMRTIYAMNYGEDGARKLDKEEEDYLNTLREQYGDTFTEEDAKTFRRNAYANAFQKCRELWNGSPVEVTDQSLLRLITNKNIDAESLGLLGVFADVQRVNPMNTFSRSAELSSLDAQIKDDFFRNKERTLKEAQNSMSIAQGLYHYEDDGTIASTAGQLYDMTVGAAVRQYGVGGALLMEGVGLALAPFTNGMSLQAVNGFMFAKDMFEITKNDISYNAMLLDPSLTKDDVQHSALVNGVSGTVALANVFGFGTALKAGEKLLKVGSGLDKAFKAFEKEGSNAAAKQFVMNRMVDSAKVLGVSEGVNVAINSATMATTQLTTNIVGNNKNIWQNVVDAAIDGGKMGAAFGLTPLPAAATRSIRDVWKLHKAQSSALNKLSNTAETATVQSALAKQIDPDGVMGTLHEAEGFHELRTFVNIDEAREWLQKNGREASDEVRAKIEEAEKDGLTEISFDPNEQAKMGDDYKSFFDELGKKEIDDMSPLEAAEALSGEEKAKAEEAIQQAKDMQDAVDQRMDQDCAEVARAMYASMEQTDMPTKTRDAIVAMNDAMFRGLSKLLGIPVNELWHSINLSWRNFDKTLYVDPNIERAEKKLRGNYNPNDGTIYLAHGADAATAIHEYGHFTLDALMKIAKDRNAQGKPIKNLNKMLDDAFGKGWEQKADAELAEMHERFAYQFLDYILSGQRDGKKSTITPVMNAVKKLIVSAERDRARKIDKDTKFKNAEDARELNRNEYMGTQNKLWADRNAGFDAIADALFKADETMRRAEADYSSERIDNFLKEGEREKRIGDNHQALEDVEAATREADEAREECQNRIETEMIKQSGYVFSFNDAFVRKWRETIKDSKAIQTLFQNSKVARELFRKYRDEIRAKFDKTTLGALYEQIKQTKFKYDDTLRGMVEHGLLTKTDIEKLRALGVIDESASAVVSDFFGRVKEADNNKIMREKQIAEVLHTIIDFPSRDKLIYEMTMQNVVKNLQDRAKLAMEHDGIRAAFLRMKERVAQSTARILSALTKTPLDRQGVIKYAATRIISGMRLADLREDTFMRTAKNARRRTEKLVGKSEYEQAVKVNRAERVAITCANLIAKVRHNLDKQYNKNIKFLRNDRYAAEHGLSNKYMDLARFIAHKQGLYVDKKGITREQLDGYIKDYPELKGLIEKYSPLFEKEKPFLDHTVGEIAEIYDALNEIRTKARLAKNAEVNGVNYRTADLAKGVHDAFAYRKYAKDTVDANGVKHKKGDIVLDKDGKPIEIKRTTKDLTTKKGTARAEATGVWGYVHKYSDRLKAGLGRISSFCEWIDGKTDGLVANMLYFPITHISAEGEQAIKKCQESINKVIGDVKWKAGVVVSPLIDKVTGKVLEFGNGQGIYGNAGYHLFGFLLHMGNEENWRKLLLAQGWEEKDVFAFIQKMVDEEYITKETLTALNKIWAQFDEQFKLANETYYSINGRYLRKVEAREIKIKLKDGEVFTLTGGYAPLIADSRRNGVKTKPIDFDAMHPDDYEKQLFENDGVNRSPNFMKERTQAVYYVDFNPNRMLAVMPKVANYATIMPKIREIYNFWNRGDVQSTLKEYAPHAFNDFIKPFIMRALKRSAIKTGDVFGNELLNNITNNVGMNLMFMNTANVVTQLSGIVSAMQRVGAYYLVKAFGSRGQDYIQLRDKIIDMSPLMKSRIVESNSHLVESITHITSGAKGNTAWNKFRGGWSHWRNFSNKYAYFLQKYVQDRIDVAVFKGAFDQEKAKAMAELNEKVKNQGGIDPKSYETLEQEVDRHCVRVAEMAVIKTQSSSNMLDKSAYESSSALNKLVFQFGNYFLTVVNSQVEEFNRLQRSNATFTDKAKVLALNFMLGVVLPSYIAEGIMKTARGDWWNKNNDEDDLLIDLFAVQPVKQLTSAIPYFNGVANGFIDSLMGSANHGGFLNAPVVSSIDQISGSLSRLLQGKVDGRTCRSAGMLIGISLGVAPANFLSKEVGNSIDFKVNNIKHNGWISDPDLMRTMLTGTVRSDKRKKD